MARTRDDTIKEATEDTLEQLRQQVPRPSVANIKGDIIDAVGDAIRLENSTRPTNEKWNVPDKLEPVQIAECMMTFHTIRRIALAGMDRDSDYDIMAVYQDGGDNAGIYLADDTQLRSIARKYNYMLTSKEFKEVEKVLREKAPRTVRCCERNLVPVNNGIFDYDTKQLMPFSPDMVFLYKTHVNYNPRARNITIHNPEDGTDWDVESWMTDLMDNDMEMVNVIWEVIGACVRPNVRWEKAAWFFSETGSNGKGTLCELMRQLIGEGGHTSIPLSDMGKEFRLEPLIFAQDIIVDENDVGTYIDKAANLKAIITNDVLQINRKFKTPVAYQFKGFMVQCLNEMPRVRDKSDSFYRRQLFIPFTKCFTGAERKYIKNDYLHRKEVLEYVLYKVLNMNYYILSTPKACQDVLQEYKAYNDPVREYLSEIMPELVWDLVPKNFLYDLYCAWYKMNFPGRNETSKPKFYKELEKLIEDYPEWKYDGKKPIKPVNKMDWPEPLIAEFNLESWMNPFYKSSNDVTKKCCPALKETYTGIMRKK